MSRGNQIDVKSVECLECRLRLFSVEEEDVRIVFLRLLDDNGEIIFIVVAFAGGEVLTKCII